MQLLYLFLDCTITDLGNTNPSQEGRFNSINPLVEGVPHIFAVLHLGGPHIFTGLEYSRSSDKGHTSFPVVQFIGLQYSVLGNTLRLHMV